MNIYNVSSGDADPNNDYFRMYAAMDAGSASTIRIYPVKVILFQRWVLRFMYPASVLTEMFFWHLLH